METEGQKGGAAPIGKEAEVSDADETLWKQMKEEATQKFVGRKCHGTASVAVGAVSPAECDVSICKRNQAVVGNGHSVGVAAEVTEDMFRPAEGALAVDDPVMAV